MCFHFLWVTIQFKARKENRELGIMVIMLCPLWFIYLWDYLKIHYSTVSWQQRTLFTHQYPYSMYLYIVEHLLLALKYKLWYFVATMDKNPGVLPWQYVVCRAGRFFSFTCLSVILFVHINGGVFPRDKSHWYIAPYLLWDPTTASRFKLVHLGTFDWQGILFPMLFLRIFRWWFSHTIDTCPCPCTSPGWPSVTPSVC